jgi:hypothetical protein
MFEVILSPEARAFYAEAAAPLARKLARAFAQLERDPRRHTTSNVFPVNWLAVCDTAWVIGAFSIESTIAHDRSSSWSSLIAARFTIELDR